MPLHAVQSLAVATVCALLAHDAPPSIQPPAARPAAPVVPA